MNVLLPLLLLASYGAWYGRYPERDRVSRRKCAQAQQSPSPGHINNILCRYTLQRCCFMFQCQFSFFSPPDCTVHMYSGQNGWNTLSEVAGTGEERRSSHQQNRMKFGEEEEEEEVEEEEAHVQNTQAIPNTRAG